MAGSPKPAYTPDRGASTPGMQPGSTGSGLPPRSGNARAPGSMSRPASWAGRRAAHADVVRHLGMPGGPRDRAGLLHNTRWRIAAAALAVLLLHMISANIVIPSLTHRLVGGSGPSAEKTSPAARAGGKPADGGIIRMLAETVIGGDGALTSKQSELVRKYKGKLGRGGDVWVQRDALTNPLRLPPADAAAAGAPGNVQPYAARTLNALYRDKCSNDTILTYASATGREWVTTSRAWTKAHGGGVSQFRWCRGGSDAEVPELKQVLLLKSNKTRHPRGVTIVTQLSLERTSMLEQQCALWPHTIAAVVYIPLTRGKIFSAEEEGWHLEPLARGVAEMEAMFERMRASACALDLEVVAEERCTRDLAGMYPANAVRNRALTLATTDMVLLLDVDFVVDLSLARLVGDDGGYESLLADLEARRAMVLPAFEAWDQTEWGRRLALEAVHQGKDYIAHKFMYNIVIGFHMSHYPQGHEKTNFWRWINTTEAYEVEYQIGFEPYILMARKFVPYYDERFRGYYWNKVQHLMHISMQNRFQFVIHPEAFVVHIPHRKPATKWRTRRSGQKERNHVMFLEALEDMKRRRFVPVTAFPHLCLPPALQLAAAEAVGPEAAAQAAALRAMAAAVAPLPGQGAAAELAGGEVSAAVERPAVADVAVERERAARRAEELQRDLEDLQALQAQVEVEGARAVPEAERAAAEAAAQGEASDVVAGLQRAQAAGGGGGATGGAGGEEEEEEDAGGEAAAEAEVDSESGEAEGDDGGAAEGGVGPGDEADAAAEAESEAAEAAEAYRASAAAAAANAAAGAGMPQQRSAVGTTSAFAVRPQQ